MLRRRCEDRHTDPAVWADSCPYCRRYTTDPRYRRLWDAAPPPGPGQAGRQRLGLDLPCVHRGAAVGKYAACTKCDVHACGLGGTCLVNRVSLDHKCCGTCPDRAERLEEAAPASAPPRRPARRWACGVTTVPERFGDLLPRTLASLAAAGFDRPRLFVDGARESEVPPEFARGGLTCRTPRVRTAGAWLLALWELYLRDPTADRYAVFQDDLVASRGLRAYLDQCKYPEKGYWNLYTFPSNQKLCPRDGRGREKVGWYESNQLGRGAVALAFSRPAVVKLLASEHMAARAQDGQRGHRAVDGGVVTALGQAGYREYVHHPSLVQHTGAQSSMGNRPHPLALSFRGEGFDCLSLLGAP